MDINEWREIHQEYLASPEFADVKRAVWIRDRYKCTKCGEREPGFLQVHHKTYNYVLHELNWEFADFDLEVLSCILVCDTCHCEIHGIIKYPMAETYEW